VTAVPRAPVSGAGAGQGGRAVPLQTVEPQRLYRQIAGQLAALIDNGEFPVGSRLPAERELAALLGVSRTSVREAIISLEIAGLVEVRVGTGIFVRARTQDTAAPPGPPPAADAEAAGPFELLAARALIEGEIASVAARTASPDDLAALRETIARMRDNESDVALRDAADRAFHERIAAATGNGALALVVAGLWDQRRGDLWTKIEAFFHTPALGAQTILDHEAIVAALEARDPAAARAAMQRHLRRVAREFERRWDEMDADEGRARAPPAAAPRKRKSTHHAVRRTHPEGATS
jgi:DNA-binding FadR family transcriptional regulator